MAQDFGDLKPLNLDDDDDFGFKNQDIIDDSGFDSAQKRRTYEVGVLLKQYTIRFSLHQVHCSQCTLD